ncbi:TetR family transcriptional regulator [Stenotrophomonas rhizophila]|nr:TetR family transcriptional regulator [Stenotrophomonas rhizophila]
MTKDRILEAALDCFHEHGVPGTTLAMIGTRAGYTRGAIYWHFENKTQILQELVSREHVPFADRLRAVASTEQPNPTSALRAALLLSVKEVAEQPRLRSMVEVLMRSDLSDESRALQSLQVRLLTEEREIVARVFERAASLGQLRKGVSPADVARTMMCCLSGLMYSAMLEPNVFDLERDGAQIFDAILSAYVHVGTISD